MGKVGAITKGRKNQSQGYAFRGIDDFYNAMQIPLSECGVFFVPEVLESSIIERATKSGGTLIYTTLKVAYTFYAKDGSSVRTVVIGEAMDSGDKSSNKAMSAALKYALMQVFCIPTEEDNDADAHTHVVAPKAIDWTDGATARTTIIAALKQRGLTTKDAITGAVNDWCAECNAPNFDSLTATQRQQFNDAIVAGKYDPKPTP